MSDAAELEKTFFGCLLLRPKDRIAQAKMHGVKCDWFQEDSWGTMWKACENLFEQGGLIRKVSDDEVESVDAVTIWQEAKRIASDPKWKLPCENLVTADFMFKAMDEANYDSYFEQHIGELRHCVVEKRVKELLQVHVPRIRAGWELAITGILNGLGDIVKKFSGVRVGQKKELCAELEQEEWMSWHMRVDPNGPKDLEWVPGLRTPFRMLTRLYMGIAARLNIIAARPSVGKTSFIINLVHYWIDNGVKVYFNSLDMPMKDIIDRMRIEKSRVSLDKKRFTPTEKNLTKLKEASKWINESTFEVCETKYIEDFVTDIAIRHASGNCDVIVLDHLQKIFSRRVKESEEYATVTYCSDVLKTTANQLRIPIIALCQLSRPKAAGKGDAEKQEPQLEDLRGSGAIEQDASTVLFLHRDLDVLEKWKDEPPYWLYKDEAYGREHAAEDVDAIWLLLKKNQNGKKGRLPMLVLKPYFCWKLADYKAQPIKTEVTKGVVTQKSVDNRPCFKRFYRDWRKDSWEEQLEGKMAPPPVEINNRFILLDDAATRKGGAEARNDSEESEGSSMEQML